MTDDPSGPTPYLSFRAMLFAAYRAALAQALPPKPKVARHWVSADQLTFLALVPDQGAFHLAFSFGLLKDSPPPTLAPHTAGLFRLTSAIFPAVNAELLTRTLTALVPPTVDGPTRTFLLRVSAQLATAEVAATFDHRRALLPLATSKDFVVTVPRRGDLLHEPASTPRIPANVEERVRRGLALVAPPLSGRLETVFSVREPGGAAEPSLLEVVRRCEWRAE